MKNLDKVLKHLENALYEIRQARFDYPGLGIIQHEIKAKIDQIKINRDGNKEG
jgi:hypothetical protein